MKRIISLLLALVIAISAAIPAYATGDGNMDSGGSGMGDGTKTNYWNPGMDGVRLWKCSHDVALGFFQLLHRTNGKGMTKVMNPRTVSTSFMRNSTMP